jgi:holo-[acyl-carrier protein] synthase
VSAAEPVRAQATHPDTWGCRVGVDLTSVSEVRAALDAFGDRYARRLFTEHELASSAAQGGLSAESLAARFAAKEAAVKVLEPTGPRPAWRDIEVRRRPDGACRLRLHGAAASLAAAQRLGPMSVSLSHEAGLAVAVVVAAAPDADRCDTKDPLEIRRTGGWG